MEYDYFAPKDDLFSGQYSQDTGTSAEINLVHMARRPNGDKAVIVGTTTGYLLRYEGKDEVRYFNDVRDSNFLDADGDGDKDFDDSYVQISFGSELVSGNYSNNVKNVSVSTGSEYYFKKGGAEISLTNGNQSLTASGFFKAQSSTVTLNSYVGDAAVSASIKKRNTSSDRDWET